MLLKLDMGGKLPEEMRRIVANWCVPDYKEIKMSTLKKIKFVETSMKVYPCDCCKKDMSVGSSYFTFEETESNSYNSYCNTINRRKVCFYCYPEMRRLFRKDSRLKSIKAEVRNISNTVDSLADTITSVNDQLGKVNDRLANLED